MKDPQNFRNHARFDPPFHFFLAPVLLLNVIFWIVFLVHHWPAHILLNIWLLLIAIVLLLLSGMMRSYALRVQDRVIRLEERLRYAQLLTPETAAAAHGLTVKQIIALRFASDAELPALVQRTLTENLQSKQIKESITAWRADNLRV